MNEFPVLPTDRHPRGQVGIGTLIIFIAMILVASIAGGVLLQTTGVLQSSSQTVGEESTAQIANQIQVISRVGNVSSSSETVTVKVYNDTHLVLTGWGGRQTNPEPKTSVTVEEGTIVYLEAGGTSDGESDQFIFGSLSITYTFDELAALTKSDRARVSFEIIDDEDTVRLTDELHNTDIGVVDPPVDMEASSGDFLRFSDYFGGFPDHNFGNDSDGSSYPAGSSYVLNHTEEQSRQGPLAVVDTVSITVRPSPGSSPIDLQNATVHYTSDTTTAELSYASGEPTGESFTTTALTGSGTVLQPTDQAIIELNTTRIGDPNRSLRAGERAQVWIVTENGARTSLTLTVPPTLSGEMDVQL
jgi:flagellin-like protein